MISVSFSLLVLTLFHGGDLRPDRLAIREVAERVAAPAPKNASISVARATLARATEDGPGPDEAGARTPLASTRMAQDVAVAARSVSEARIKAAAPNRGVPDDYIIGEGDVLNISVWREPDASVPSVVVRPDGRISMPMLKEVRVSGLTPGQAEQVITQKLSKFISTADVTVIVASINSKKIYFVGGVKKEEPIPYTYRMTILQALSEAGGLTDYAKKKKIYVLRHANGIDSRLPFNYDAAVKGDSRQLNMSLMPGDTVVVPK